MPRDTAAAPRSRPGSDRVAPVAGAAEGAGDAEGAGEAISAMADGAAEGAGLTPADGDAVGLVDPWGAAPVAAAGGNVQAGAPAAEHAARNAVAPTPPATRPLRLSSVRRLRRIDGPGGAWSDRVGSDRSTIESSLH